VEAKICGAFCRADGCRRRQQRTMGLYVVDHEDA
jgi:hypothetical protein